MITITHQGGVGVNGWSSIARDGVPVAVIERHGMTACRISSHYYHETLGHFKNVASAKAAALTMHFPDEREVYETICARIEPARRRWKTHEHHADFVRLAHAVIEGSNSARQDIEQLFAAIEAYATDRSDTQRTSMVEGTWRARSHLEPLYPEPPKEKAA